LKFGGSWAVSAGSHGPWDVINTTASGMVVLTQVKASRDDSDGWPGVDTYKLKELLSEAVSHSHRAKKTVTLSSPGGARLRRSVGAVMRIKGVTVVSFEIYGVYGA
ncbi:MAG: hypothetical protein KGL39_21110, partial [Patescibacteria group bacterium]|nr:hypothetical protein [Patescibacteria group bacterium]